MKYIQEAFDANWITTEGTNLVEIERQMCEKLGCKYAVSLTNGTATLHLAVKLAGVKEGDMVFCTDMTFDATVNAIVYEKAIPVFIDTEYDTWNMDPVALEKAFELYPNTKVIVVVNLYGTPASHSQQYASVPQPSAPKHLIRRVSSFPESTKRDFCRRLTLLLL